MKTIDFTDKVVIVTGAAGNIGGGVAKVFAEAGATVYITDLNLAGAQAKADEFNANGGKCFAAAMDGTKCEEINRVIDEIAAKEGKIDVLVNVTGMIVSKGYMEATEEDMDITMRVNLYSADNACRAVLRHMIPRKYGKIVNVASIAARHGGPRLAQYSASKFAEIGMTQSIALAVAQDNINVNAVCPGFIDSPIQRKLIESYMVLNNRTFEEAWDDQTKRVPLRRWQSPEDIGNACLFLASDMAENITGQAINVDGGVRLN